MGLASLFADLVEPTIPVRFEAFDGSSWGSTDPEATISLRSVSAIQYLATAPGDVGLARAFTTGAIEVDGDLFAALVALVRHRAQDVRWSQRIQVLRELGPQVLSRPPIPPEEFEPAWRRGLRRHSKERDAAAIEHHYDVSNDLYEILLGPTMTYTCALFPSPGATLEQAQDAKHELVCQKLALRPGMRLLDVGCGWGAMTRYAAAHHGVEVVAVTLSRSQAEWGRKAVADQGLDHLVDLRYGDYRDVTETGFDAVSSIGLTEHIGAANLGSYARFLTGKLRPGGRLLNHCITRPHGLHRARAGRFIDRYIFPDGELLGPGTIISALHDNGLEVRHAENLREHYTLTCRAWLANLEARWDDCVDLVGLRKARVWRLYLAASAAGFEVNRIQLHQVLGVRLDERGRSGFPLRPAY